MVRTQLYLPENIYSFAKEEAKKKNMSFAAYVRVLIDEKVQDKKKKKTLYEKYPFIGMFKLGENASDNEAIDEFLLDQYEK